MQNVAVNFDFFSSEIIKFTHHITALIICLCPSSSSMCAAVPPKTDPVYTDKTSLLFVTLQNVCHKQQMWKKKTDDSKSCNSPWWTPHMTNEWWGGTALFQFQWNIIRQMNRNWKPGSFIQQEYKRQWRCVGVGVWVCVGVGVCGWGCVGGSSLPPALLSWLVWFLQAL